MRLQAFQGPYRFDSPAQDPVACPTHRPSKVDTHYLLHPRLAEYQCSRFNVYLSDMLTEYKCLRFNVDVPNMLTDHQCLRFNVHADLTDYQTSKVSTDSEYKKSLHARDDQQLLWDLAQRIELKKMCRQTEHGRKFASWLDSNVVTGCSKYVADAQNQCFTPPSPNSNVAAIFCCLLAKFIPFKRPPPSPAPPSSVTLKLGVRGLTQCKAQAG